MTRFDMGTAKAAQIRLWRATTPNTAPLPSRLFWIDYVGVRLCEFFCETRDGRKLLRTFNASQQRWMWPRYYYVTLYNTEQEARAAYNLRNTIDGDDL